VSTESKRKYWLNLGAHAETDGTRFRVYTTHREPVLVRIVDARGTPLQTHAMEPLGDGLFEVLVPGIGHGALYDFVVGDRHLPDPFARFLPHGVHGPAMVYQPRHQWTHECRSRPLREHVIYELHVGTFTSSGTYAAARAHLGHLAALGVSAIELMPLAAFPGTRGWGYDGVALFAPFASYGEPDELRAFIDEAHGLGLSVFLDVVYNHFGPSGNYLPAYSPRYFSSEIKNAWGPAPDLTFAPMRQIVLENAHHWLEEFRFDGLRLDATHAILDPSPRHILRELSDSVKALRPPRLLIAEDDRNDPQLFESMGLDAVWADDFHHAARVTVTGERDGYYAAYSPGAETVATTIQQGWLYTGQPYPLHGRPRGKPAPGLPAEAFVYCIQNHDQVGNRAVGDRLTAKVDVDSHAALSTLLLFLPMTPLLFMGQEWAASTPFQYFTDHEPELGRLVSEGRCREFEHFPDFIGDGRHSIPDPQALATFERSRLDWSELTRAPHAQVLDLHRRCIQLRRTDPVLRESGRDGLQAAVQAGLLVVSRTSRAGERVLVLNLGAAPANLRSTDLPLGQARVLLASRDLDARSAPDELPGRCALVLATR
jgi:maltooligosyltrehalose trehalohydrolase